MTHDPYADVPPRIAREMRLVAARHLPSQTWDPTEDPAYARAARTRGRVAALRALRYGFPAWRFEVSAGRLVVARHPDTARSTAPARMVAP